MHLHVHVYYWFSSLKSCLVKIYVASYEAGHCFTCVRDTTCALQLASMSLGPCRLACHFDCMRFWDLLMLFPFSLVLCCG